MRWSAALRRIAEWLREDLSPLAVLACGAVFLLADWADQRAGGSFFPGGLLDEPAHFLTALLLLQLLPARRRRRVALPALVASVAIDLDHVPQYLGYQFLTVGTPRPYTHSLATLVALLVLALAIRRHRTLFIGLALGLVLHFFRDLAEGNGGGGVALFWPLSDHAYNYPHPTNAAVMACVTVAVLGRGIVRRWARPALPGWVRRRPASRASA